MEPNDEDDIQFVARPVDEQDLVFNLAGAILAEKPPHRNGVLNGFKTAWGAIGDGDYRIVPVDDRIYSIMVRDAVLAAHILESGPWNVDNRLFNVIPWSRDLAIEEVDFSGIKFWIQIHNVPLGVMTDGTARNIARRVGKVLEVEDPIKMPRNYLRVRVLLDGRKPLYSGFYEPRDGRNRRRISIKYERLREYCYKCGRIGHTLQFCHWNDGPSEIDNFYGPELCVPTSRKLNFEGFPPDDHHRSSSFWDSFGGGRGKQPRGVNAPSFVRESLASQEMCDTRGSSDLDSALQLARSHGPRQHRDLLTGKEANVTVDNLGFVSGPNVNSNPSLSDGPISTQPIMVTTSDQVQLSSSEVSNITTSLPISESDVDPEIEKYRTPIILSDFSDSDMDTSDKPQYLVTEVSDEEEMGVMIPAVVKMQSPIVSEVCLATVFNRLKLKRPFDSVSPTTCQKLQKAEIVGTIVRRPLGHIANTHSVSNRTRSQKNKAAKGRGRGKQVPFALPSTLDFNDENLCDVSISQEDNMGVWSNGYGCGGGPITATRQP